ncbi:pyroglutamyl-peptidase I [Neisseria leonii]|uniref:Pyrrolidone-carboxylate peptidase n=1 Tax=Neisseria leonii TaxID=2995413 RepID=A0A9X4E1S8_9NEIS|nr:pyroglutamyl-peptidase I [Neisseria sp. 51.81]MDD9327997.1 pyroglutamyl-peptidase I [Neisseria sp. 51.81]
MTMSTVLLTAFEPFGGESINPSWQAATRLDGVDIAGYRVAARCLPCTFSGSLNALETAIADTRPTVVIALGQAGGRPDITPERVAINWNDARIPDNAGELPCDTPVISGGPNAYFTTLPIKAVTAALQQNGIPASISYTAGTFVCNHVFYGLQHMAARYGIAKSGFVHIPYLPEQAARIKGAPSMAETTLLTALNIIIETCITQEHDLRTAGGETH